MENVTGKFLKTLVGDEFESLASASNWKRGPVYISLPDGEIILNRNLLGSKRHITYDLNSDRYRTREFSQVDWPNAVILFGCSNTFGEGLDEADTISCRLSSLINRPVLNMGVGGTSMQHALYNSAILHKIYPKPAAVIQLWTEYSRITYFHKTQAENLGAWNYEKENLYELWNRNEHNSKIQASFISLVSQQLWKDRSLYYEATHFPSTAKLLNCDLLETVDTATDGVHPGAKSSQLTAERIANALNL